MSTSIEILEFKPELREHFMRLNLEWIEKYYSVCDADIEQLGNPEKIMAEKGMVFFAKYGEEIVGTCALVWYNDSWLELIKMAVTEKYQGLKIGKQLMEAAIAKSKALGAEVLVLETAKELLNAIALYERCGFVRFELPKAHFTYNREVFAMKLDLS